MSRGYPACQAPGCVTSTVAGYWSPTRFLLPSATQPLHFRLSSREREKGTVLHKQELHTGVSTSFGCRDFLRVVQRFHAAASTCVNIHISQPCPLLDEPQFWGSSQCGDGCLQGCLQEWMFAGMFVCRDGVCRAAEGESSLGCTSEWRAELRAEPIQQDPSGHRIPCNDLKPLFP